MLLHNEYEIVCKVRTQDPENFHEEVKSLATAWWIMILNSKEICSSHRSSQELIIKKLEPKDTESVRWLRDLNKTNTIFEGSILRNKGFQNYLVIDSGLREFLSRSRSIKNQTCGPRKDYISVDYQEIKDRNSGRLKVSWGFQRISDLQSMGLYLDPSKNQEVFTFIFD